MSPHYTWQEVLASLKRNGEKKRFKRRDVQRRQSKAIRSVRHMREIDVPADGEDVRIAREDYYYWLVCA
jgi:hypothetical protein